MKRYMRSVIVLLIMLVVVAGVTGIASAKGVTTDKVKPTEIQPGSYTLHTTIAPLPVAIISKEGGPYTMKLASSGRDFKTVSGLTENEAVTQAQGFFKKNPAVHDILMKEVKAPDGTLVGYELTPRYDPLRYGASDMQTMQFRLKGNDVLAYVKPDPIIQAQRLGAS